jgi:hypothetical protein
MAAPQNLPPPPDPRMLAVLATVTYAAAVIALWGFVSLALDVDVINQADAGPLLGPAMLAASCITTVVVLLRSGPRSTPGLHAALAAASAYGAMLLVGAVGYTLIRGDLAWFALFIGGYALSPFVLGAALLAGGVVLGAWALAKRGR